jgi:hypothetical protein
MPVTSCILVGTLVWLCGTCCPLTFPPRVHCCGLYGTVEPEPLIAMGEAAATGEGAYVEGVGEGENGRLKDDAVAGVESEPYRYDGPCWWGGARVVFRRGGCTAKRLGDICGAWRCAGCGEGGGGGSLGDGGAGLYEACSEAILTTIKPMWFYTLSY